MLKYIEILKIKKNNLFYRSNIKLAHQKVVLPHSEDCRNGGERSLLYEGSDYFREISITEEELSLLAQIIANDCCTIPYNYILFAIL